jgi:hypothetical protein
MKIRKEPRSCPVTVTGFAQEFKVSKNIHGFRGFRLGNP